MWKTLILGLVLTFLTTSALPTNSTAKHPYLKFQSLTSQDEYQDNEDDEEWDDKLDGEVKQSAEIIDHHSVDAYDQPVGDSVYENTFDEPAFNTSNDTGMGHYESYISEGKIGGEIDENEQEVTFEESGGSQNEYHPQDYDRDSTRPHLLLETIKQERHPPPPKHTAEETRTPVYEPPIVPQTAFIVYSDTNRTESSSPFYHRSLTYPPDSGRDYHEQQIQHRESGYNAYPKQQEITTNSYDRRMSQVDEYWREEERLKQMYESQNTYRRPSGGRFDGWSSRIETRSQSGCIYDPTGRAVDCPNEPPRVENNYEPISMQAPSAGPPPAPMLPNTSDAIVEDKAAEAERNAFLRANKVRLSVSRWPVRDMNRLGSYPRHSACRLPPKWGVGPEERSAWFYSQTDGRCLWFSYAGHGGNANRFYSRANCESFCVFDLYDLCQNARCGYPGSQCMLRGDEQCKAYAKSRGKDLETECPPDQPVCRARRAIIPPEYDTRLIPNECMEPVDEGGCLLRNPQIRYYYDSPSNTCRAFYFHGCGGNNNRFENMQECMNHCAL